MIFIENEKRCNFSLKPDNYKFTCLVFIVSLIYILYNKNIWVYELRNENPLDAISSVDDAAVLSAFVIDGL